MATEAGRVPGEEPLAYFLTWTTYGTWLPGTSAARWQSPASFALPTAGGRIRRGSG
jgi:hypothetical protein